MSKDPFQDREAERYRNPIPSREFILKILQKREQPTSRYEIAQETKITNKAQQEALRRRLRAMGRDGQLVFTNHQCYTLPERLELLRGKVIGHRDGYGFLRVLGQKNDLYLSAEQMRHCLHGDVILAQPSCINHKGRREARVVRILEPRNNQIIGRYFTDSDTNFVVPNDHRLNFNIIIPKNDDSISHMDLVVVEIIQRATHRTKAFGKIIEVLGSSMSTGLAINMAIRTHEIPYSWPEAVKKELAMLEETIPETAIRNRVDIRRLPLVTIDSEDACDLDDAVYCERKHSGEWRLLVAIADVSYYVRPGTALDNAAYQRGTSVYFPSQVVPMLPEVLSNGICSLNLQADRLCIVCEMIISEKGQLVSYKHYEAIMHSHACLTYTNMWKILQGHAELRKKHFTTVKHLEELYRLYQILERAREKRGGISFEMEEAKFIFNSDLRIERIERTMRNNAHKIIEECMILANIASACFVEKNAEPALFRDHDRPSNDSIDNFHTILSQLGLNLKGRKTPQPIDYANFLKQITNRPDAEMLQIMLMRSMKQAVYDPENRGHFGLALTAYAHFTSPIRRYPDLLLHRAIKYLLAKKQYHSTGKLLCNGGFHYDMPQMLVFGQHCSMTERRADEATRDAIDWIKCDFLQDKIGNQFSGVISNVTNFGFFVRLNNLFIDGLVHISTLDKDYYRFDLTGQRLIGDSSGRIYRLGDTVKIMVDMVNMEERKIDFVLISNTKMPHSKKKVNLQLRKKLENYHRKSKNIREFSQY